MHGRYYAPDGQLHCGSRLPAPGINAAFTEPEEEVIAEYEQVVLYYNFESLAGDSIPDQSGNQLNGTVVSMPFDFTIEIK